MEGFGSHGASGSSGTFGSSGSSDRHHHHHDDSSYYSRSNIGNPYTTQYPVGQEQELRTSEQARNCFSILPVFILVTVGAAFGLYSPLEIESGLGYSRLLEINPLFVREIQVRRFQGVGKPVLYTFHKQPTLKESLEWSHEYHRDLDAQSHQEWALWLNKGSTVTIKYDIPGLNSRLVFAITEGKEKFRTWLYNPLDSSSSVFWQEVEGKGVIDFVVDDDGDYYFSLGNTNEQVVEVALRLEAQLKLYATEPHDSKCSLKSRICKVDFPLFGSTVVLLTTSKDDGVQHMRVTYKTRWATFIVGYGMLIAIVVLVMKMKACKKPEEPQEEKSETSPLMDQKVFNEEENGPPPSAADEHLCAVCLDASKDCFFDPCGHCATCYACGERIKASGNAICPICRQKIRTVRRLFLS